jgi:hypothetical protein
MAVPASGNELSLLKIAKEKFYDNYDVGASSPIQSAISLKYLTIGGNDGVHMHFGTSFDVTNAISPSHPDNDASYGMSEFYSYDHDFAAPGCNIAYYEGSQGTFNYPINLGTDTGTVRIEYQSFTVPDKFVFVWNGNTYTSGSTSGNYDGWVGSQSYRNALRAHTGNNSLEVTTHTGGPYPADGTPSVNRQSGGRGAISFNKNSTATSMVATIQAPLDNTAWWFSVSCPGQTVIVDSSNAIGIAPSITASNGQTSATSIQMYGNVTNKGKTSNFSTPGTISAKGFVVLPGVTNTSEFYKDTSGVTVINEDDSTINTTGSFNESATGLSYGSPSLGTVTVSNIDDEEFDVSYNISSVGSTPNSYRAWATNAAGTTYSTIKHLSNTGQVDEHGVTYCNQSFSSTPFASVSSGVLDDATGSQFTQVAGTTTTTGTKTDTIQESSVSLTANNTYRIRSVARQGSTITYGSAISSFTVPASNDFSATITTGSSSFYSTTFHGYITSPVTAGSMSNKSFNGVLITGMYWQNSSFGTDYIYIYFNGTKPSFSAISINGQSLGASSTWTSASSTSWRKVYTSNLFGSNGSSIAVTAEY